MSRLPGTTRIINGSEVRWHTPVHTVTITDPRQQLDVSRPTFAAAIHDILTGLNLSRIALIRNFLPEMAQILSEIPSHEHLNDYLHHLPEEKFIRQSGNPPTNWICQLTPEDDELYRTFNHTIVQEITAAVHTYNDRYITAGNREKTLLLSSDPANTLNLVWNLAAHPSDLDILSKPHLRFPTHSSENLTATIALSPETHLLLYCEINDTWDEVILQRGDILLARSDKYFKVLNHREDSAHIVIPITNQEMHVALSHFTEQYNLHGEYFYNGADSLRTFFANLRQRRLEDHRRANPSPPRIAPQLQLQHPDDLDDAHIHDVDSPDRQPRRKKHRPTKPPPEALVQQRSARLPPTARTYNWNPCDYTNEGPTDDEEEVVPTNAETLRQADRRSGQAATATTRTVPPRLPTSRSNTRASLTVPITTSSSSSSSTQHSNTGRQPRLTSASRQSTDDRPSKTNR